MLVRNRIKEILTEKHITQKELAIRMGVTEATISRYISGKRKLNLINAANIARCLGVEFMELINFEKEVENE